MRNLLAVLMLVLLALIWLVVTGASADTIQIANAITTFVVIVVLPLLLKYVKLDGPMMAGVTYAVSFAIALVAALLSGELQLSQLNGGSAADLFAFATALYGIQQLVYAAIKDHAVAGALVK